MKVYIDDIAINDTNGTSPQISYPGPGYVVAGHPNANGTQTTGWTRGGSDSGADWSQVNEVTPNDATNFIAAAAGGTQDNFTTGALPFSGNDSINVFHVGVRYNNDTGDVSTNFVVQLIDPASNTLNSGSLVAGSTTWRTNGTSTVIYNAYPITVYPGQAGVQPITANINNWQIAVANVTAGTHKIQVTTMWTMIDYWPAVHNSIFVKQAVNRASTY